MNILNRIIGLILIGIGLIMVYVEYLVLTTISEIAAWLGDFMGVSADATTGLQVMLYVPAGGIIVGLFAVACLLFYLGYALIKG